MNRIDKSKQTVCWNNLIAQAGAFVDMNALAPHTPEQQFADILEMLEVARAIGSKGTGRCRPMHGEGGIYPLRCLLGTACGHLPLLSGLRLSH